MEFRIQSFSDLLLGDFSWGIIGAVIYYSERRVMELRGMRRT